MQEPVIIINGVSTEEDSQIQYVGVLSLDVEIFKASILQGIISKINSTKYQNNMASISIYNILNSISIDAYKYVFMNGINNTTSIISLARIIHYYLQFIGLYISEDDIIFIISSQVNSNPTQNHQ